MSSSSNQGPKRGSPPGPEQPAGGKQDNATGRGFPMLEPDAAQARRIYEQIVADRGKAHDSVQAILKALQPAIFADTKPAPAVPAHPPPGPASPPPSAAGQAEIAALELQTFSQFTTEAQQNHEAQRKLMEARPASPLPVLGYPTWMFPPLPPPPPPPASPAQLMSVAQLLERWLARCDAFNQVAERLRAAGRPGFAERLQFEKVDTAQALKIVVDMARSAGATQQAIWQIASDAQRAVTDTQLAINARQQQAFAQANQAFADYQQGIRRVICPDCQNNYFTSRYCRTCGGAGMVLVKA